ncbi:hypothetical protein CEXT_450521 [Caerostris extrusa]|uniref:Uncharacterized protein n=1 Tax=Caerostris extrusa TaxID=172846 RepID=A0AAV4MNS9_CAEEX|nr:hypothetical protein CEXT_450521 [Caerostris extrusa]
MDDRATQQRIKRGRARLGSGAGKPLCLSSDTSGNECFLVCLIDDSREERPVAQHIGTVLETAAYRLLRFGLSQAVLKTEINSVKWFLY